MQRKRYGFFIIITCKGNRFDNISPYYWNFNVLKGHTNSLKGTDNCKQERQSTKERVKVCPLMWAERKSLTAKVRRKWLRYAVTSGLGPQNGRQEHNVAIRARRNTFVWATYCYTKPQPIYGRELRTQWAW